MPGRPRNVEKLWKNSAKAAGCPSHSPINTSAAARSPKCESRRVSSVADTSCERRSYSASSFMSERMSGTSPSVAVRISSSGIRNVLLDSRPHKGLRYLHGIGRGSLEQVVRDAPVADGAVLDPYPANVYSLLPRRLQRRREVRGVSAEDDAGGPTQDFENLGQTYIALGLDVDALGVAGVDGDAD